MSDPNTVAKPDSRTVQALFQEVVKVLESQKSCKVFVHEIFSSSSFLRLVSWTLSHDAMKAAIQTIETPESQKFIEDYFYKILHMMTQQK